LAFQYSVNEVFVMAWSMTDGAVTHDKEWTAEVTDVFVLLMLMLIITNAGERFSELQNSRDLVPRKWACHRSATSIEVCPKS